MPLILGIFASKVLRSIQDFFNRTTTTSLGTANTGQTWVNTRGTWFANGSAAQSNDAASSYPLSSISFAQDVTVSASVTEGTGVSFWVTDANNWYATVSYNTQSSYSCNCQSCCNTCQHTGGSCGTVTTGYCVNGGYGPCFGNQCTQNPGCSGFVTGAYIPAGTPITCTNSDCSACGSYPCNCQTCYTNNYYMRLLKSVSGTVSQVISDYTISSTAVAIKVTTSNNTITETAYSDTGMTTSIGSTSTTQTSPIKGLGVGIIKAPAGVTQGSTVDSFNAN